MGKKKISLEVKFSIVVVLAMLGGFGVMLVLTIQSMSKGFERHYEEKADIAKAYIVDKVEDKMLSKTAETIPLIINDLDKIRKLEGVTELRIFNSEGEEIFAEVKGPPEPGVKEAVTSGAPVNFHKKSNGSTLFSSITPIKNKPECSECHSKDEKLGAIVLSMSMKGMEDDIKHQKESYILIFWIMCLTLVSITLFTVKKLFLEPLFLIYKGTEEIKKGNLDSRVTVKSRDEIGGLADSFNTMASSLKASVDSLEDHAKELEVLNSISSAVTQSIDLEKVLKDVLDYLSKLEALSIDKRALIFLADESKKQLRLAAYKDISEDFIRSESVVNYGDGLCGISAETGEIVTSADCLSDKRHSRECESSVKHGHIILPLKVKEKLVGVLCLFTPPLQEVSDREIHLYKTIADIISVAIENATIHKTTLEIARTDGLTGLYNHSEFQHILELEVQRAKRYGREFSLLMLDIDFFKNFNDTYGHQTGDDILRAISQKIKGEVRSMDVPARYGGEEFAVILPETPLQFGVQVAERLCKTVSGHMFHIQGSNVQVTLSIGVAAFPADAEISDDLIKRADQALYLAKKSGRNRVCRFSANI
jgi:diguanylate cyclase (GGDEF)-like protein